MFNFKSKKIILPLFFSALLTLLSAPLAHAELGGSGGSAARDAAEQRAAVERKLAEKKQRKEEAKKAAEAQQGQPAETQPPAEGNQEKPAAQ